MGQGDNYQSGHSLYLVRGVDKYTFISAVMEICKSGKLSEVVKKDLQEIVLLSWVLYKNSDNQ